MTGRASTTRLVAGLVLAGMLGACASSGLRQARLADELQDYDVAVARYAKVVREHPDNREAQQGLARAKLRAAEDHYTRGRRLASQGRYEDAELELQIATELNPANADAARELHTVRVAIRTEVSTSDHGETPLESLLARTRDLPPAGYQLPDTRLPARIATGQQSTTRAVYLLIAQLGHLSLTFDPDFRDAPAPVSLLSGMTIRQALDAVASATHTFYRVTGPSTLLVVPNTPAKQREYTEEVVRQFTVQNADLKETIDALRVVTDARYIAPVTGTNTILVRDTPERVRVIGRFLSAFDKARPEVVVDVEVLEVDRSQLQEFGLQLASPGSAGINGTADVNRTGGVSLESLRNLGQADVLDDEHSGPVLPAAQERLAHPHPGQSPHPDHRRRHGRRRTSARKSPSRG